MMEITLILLMINFCCVGIIGYLNAPNNILSQIINWCTDGKIKRVELLPPFGCPLCMCWIISLIYLCFAINWTFFGIMSMITLALLNALLTKYTLYIIETIDLALCKLLGWLQQLLK